MKRLMIIVIFLVVGVFSFAEVAVVMPEIDNPLTMAVDDQQIYVVQKAEIFVYSAKDYKFKFKFGQAGEGPKEFKTSPGGEGVMVFPQKDALVINSPGKLSLYKKDGKFIKEMKLPPGLGSNLLQPVGDNYVSMNIAVKMTGEISAIADLFDADLNKIKGIYHKKMMSLNNMEFPPKNFVCYAQGNRFVILEMSDDVSVGIFDETGKQVASIKEKTEKLDVYEGYKERVYETYKTMPDTKPVFEMLKSRIKFLNKFPAVQNMFLGDGKIYLQSYREKDSKIEYNIYDFNGKLLKKAFLPLHYLYGIRVVPQAFRNGKLYQLVENEEDEEWELHITKAL